MRLTLVLVLVLLSLLQPGHASSDTLPCKTRNVTVQGTSMAPRIADGETITVVSGGAACAEPLARGDVLVIRTDSHPLPLIKALRGLPGDTLAVRGGSVYVNDTLLHNTEGAAYQLSAGRAAMIELYAHDFGGIIPLDTFLVLGENPAGTTDSTCFGLLPRAAIIGRVIGH